MIAIIDNYDSFTYNLAHLVKELGAETDVLRNDRFEMKDLEQYDKIILSPGPGIPEEAGLLLDVIRTYSGKKPILGVCLGEQAIGQVFGGRLVNLSNVFHGVQTTIRIKSEKTGKQEEDNKHEAVMQNKIENIIQPDYIFRGLPEEIPVGRYHSWVVDTEAFPETLAITAVSPEADYGIETPAVRRPRHSVSSGIRADPERQTDNTKLAARR